MSSPDPPPRRYWIHTRKGDRVAHTIARTYQEARARFDRLLGLAFVAYVVSEPEEAVGAAVDGTVVTRSGGIVGRPAERASRPAQPARPRRSASERLARSLAPRRRT